MKMLYQNGLTVYKYFQSFLSVKIVCAFETLILTIYHSFISNNFNYSTNL